MFLFSINISLLLSQKKTFPYYYLWRLKKMEIIVPGNGSVTWHFVHIIIFCICKWQYRQSLWHRFLPFFFSVNPVCPIFLSIKIEKSDSYSSSAKNMNINDDSNESPGPACKLFVCSSSFCTSLRDLKKEKKLWNYFCMSNERIAWVVHSILSQLEY